MLPVDQRLTDAGKRSLIQAMGAGIVVEPTGRSATGAGVAVEPGDAVVVATSGSTGEPKGVVLTHVALDASAHATSSRLGVRPGDEWLACLPLSHVGGLSVVTRALLTGTALTVRSSFDPAFVDTSGATLVSLVPTALRRIDPTRWRAIVLGGSRPPADRPANVIATYGMTETGSGVVYDGVALDGVDVRAVDGEIHVRCPMLLRCYRDGTDPRLPDGWFPTGDLGEVGPHGRVTVYGRRGDLIITGGENVWPEPVEAVLRGHPGVADVAVVGVDDPEWGSAVTALVVPTDVAHPPSLASLREHVKAQLPAFHAPREMRTVAALPRTTLGKLRRAELAELRR